MRLTCICRTRAEILGATGLALRGQYDRGDEYVTDPDCPMHGRSAEAKAQREAFKEHYEQVQDSLRGG